MITSSRSVAWFQAFATLDIGDINAGYQHRQLCLIDDQTLSIRLADRLLYRPGLEPLHEYRQPISVPPYDLDAIAPAIDEHEVIAQTNIASELALYNCMQAVIRTSPIDRLHVEIDSSRRRYR